MNTHVFLLLGTPICFPSGPLRKARTHNTMPCVRMMSAEMRDGPVGRGYQLSVASFLELISGRGLLASQCRISVPIHLLWWLISESCFLFGVCNCGSFKEKKSENISYHTMPCVKNHHIHILFMFFVQLLSTSKLIIFSNYQISSKCKPQSNGLFNIKDNIGLCY